MAKPSKQQQKDEKKEKKKLKQGGASSSSFWVALAVGFAALLVAMPQLMRGRPLFEQKLSFPAPPDARSAACRKDWKVKSTARDSVSIIIPYLNEEWFRIEATMQSLLKYTDMSLV